MIKLKVENLSLSYGAVEVLKDVSLTLDRGKVVVLLGPSGSGKTTLLRAIAGLELPKTGRVMIDDAVVFDSAGKVELPVEERNLGLVFQSYALWPHRTVFDNVRYGLKLRKVPAEEAEKRVRSALSELGLGKLADRYPHQLSGGQQQRVAIARALVYNPPVILMDEPLSNLDTKLREEAKAWLRALIINLELTAVIVTHDQSEAMAMADRIILLSNGAVEQIGTPEDIYNEPKTLCSAEFFGLNNRLDGRIEQVSGSTARIAGAGFDLEGRVREPVPEGSNAAAVVRSERVNLVDGPGQNRFQVTLLTSMFGGDRWQHVFRCGETLLRINGRSRLSGESHWIEIPADDLWIFPAPAETAA